MNRSDGEVMRGRLGVRSGAPGDVRVARGNEGTVRGDAWEWSEMRSGPDGVGMARGDEKAIRNDTRVTRGDVKLPRAMRGVNRSDVEAIRGDGSG
ncbi:hypothetical protein [Streptosporangium sp. NPDC020145]|uniref:hypothetical protein n=1 Tax=Streptosporangium sp. NPDC020145 TaxID=3154694 RepID=UPI003420C35C